MFATSVYPHEPKLYTLRCPKSNEMIYVGATTKPLHIRLYEHIKESLIKPNSKKSQWIASLTNEKLSPIIVLEKTFKNKEGLYKAEKKMIAKLFFSGVPIVNSKIFIYKKKESFRVETRLEDNIFAEYIKACAQEGRSMRAQTQHIIKVFLKLRKIPLK